MVWLFDSYELKLVCWHE